MYIYKVICLDIIHLIFLYDNIYYILYWFDVLEQWRWFEQPEAFAEAAAAQQRFVAICAAAANSVPVPGL